MRVADQVIKSITVRIDEKLKKIEKRKKIREKRVAAAAAHGRPAIPVSPAMPAEPAAVAPGLPGVMTPAAAPANTRRNTSPRRPRWRRRNSSRRPIWLKPEADDPSAAPRGGRPAATRRSRQQYFRRKKMCRFCVDKIDDINYKDVRLLNSFLSERGKITPRRISGVCAPHQRRLAESIKQGRNIALIPFSISL